MLLQHCSGVVILLFILSLISDSISHGGNHVSDNVWPQENHLSLAKWSQPLNHISPNPDWRLKPYHRKFNTLPAMASEEDRRTRNTKVHPEIRYEFDEETIFRAFWDVPNHCQEKHGIEIPLAEFGIEFNSNGDWYHGDTFNVFGGSMIGNYPFLGDNNRFVNGGLPQLANITAHLEKAAGDIMAGIPSANFSGIGMIDWEAWYPQWGAIDDRYRSASIAHVRALNPKWTNDTVTKVAELEWTQGARLFMESTLKLAQQLRPKAIWGFYHYPYCTTQKVDSCLPWQVKLNDEILWLFDTETVIYPSIYLIVGSRQSSASVDARLAEAFRMRDKSNDPKGVVLSYTRFNYSQTNYYYTLEDLNNTILRSAEYGTHGVVFWGDNIDDRTKQTCRELQTYVAEALGPVVKMSRDGARECSKRICSSHGRCVGNILTCQAAGNRRTSGSGRSEVTKMTKKTMTSEEDMCSCRCFRGWRGSDCSIAE